MGVTSKTSAKILLVEDNINLSYFLKKFLENKGYIVTNITRGDEAWSRTQKDKFDLYLIDLGLPVVSGSVIVKKIKEIDRNASIIVVTDSISLDSEVECYKLGVNIFHKKPLNYKLLEVQISSLLKDFDFNQFVEVGDLYINIPRKVVKKEGKELHLTFNEFNLLLMLVKEECKVFSRDQILSRIFNNYRDIDNGAVDTLVSRLRKKLGTYQDTNVIETIYKSGFRLSMKYYEDFRGLL